MATRTEKIDRAMYLARQLQLTAEAHQINVARRADDLDKSADAWVRAEKTLREYLTEVIE